MSKGTPPDGFSKRCPSQLVRLDVGVAVASSSLVAHIERPVAGVALKLLECFLHKFFGHDDLRFEFVPGHTTMTATGWPLAQTPDDAIMVLPIFKTMVSFQSLCQQCPELRSLRSRRPLNDFMS